MKITQTNFHGDHNLGLFAKSSDKLCVVGNFVLDKTVKKMEDSLKVKIIKATLANTDFIGVFCCFNSNGIVLPNIANDREITLFKNLKKEFGMNLEILKTKFTAIGNLTLANDKGVVISKIFTKRNKKNIEDCLGVECEYSSVAKMSIVGSAGITTNKGCLIHRDATEEEIEKIGDILKVPVDIGTANFGSPFIGSCLIANSSGAAIGESSTGPEVTRIMETLQFL